MSVKYGKLLTLGASSVIHLAGTIVCQTAPSFAALRAGRIIQDLALAAYETLIFVLIGDLFFVHQRGLWSAMPNFWLSGASTLSSVVAGRITDVSGWRTLYHLLAGFNVIHLALHYLFVPETTFHRSNQRDLHENSRRLGEGIEMSEPSQHSTKAKSDDQSAEVASVTMASVAVQKQTWVQTSIWHGSFSDVNLSSLLIDFICVHTNAVVTYILILQAWSYVMMGFTAKERRGARSHAFVSRIQSHDQAVRVFRHHGRRALLLY